jgi:hypothetical protein
MTGRVGCRIRVANLATRREKVVAEFGQRIWLRSCSFGRSRFLGLASLVLVEHALQDGDGVAEAVVEGDQQVDVVEVLLTSEAVGEVVAWVDGGAHLAATRADEAVVAFADFSGRAFAAERGDGDGHRQVIANAAQEFGVDHGFSKLEA